MAGKFYQCFDHHDQRGTFPLKIRWQQSNNAPFFRIAIKLPKATGETLGIYIKLFYKMPAVNCSCSTAAFKDILRLKITGNNFVCLKKRNRQKRDPVYIL